MYHLLTLILFSCQPAEGDAPNTSITTQSNTQSTEIIHYALKDLKPALPETLWSASAQGDHELLLTEINALESSSNEDTSKFWSGKGDNSESRL